MGSMPVLACKTSWERLRPLRTVNASLWEVGVLDIPNSLIAWPLLKKPLLDADSPVSYCLVSNLYFLRKVTE